MAQRQLYHQVPFKQGWQVTSAGNLGHIVHTVLKATQYIESVIFIQLCWSESLSGGLFGFCFLQAADLVSENSLKIALSESDTLNNILLVIDFCSLRTLYPDYSFPYFHYPQNPSPSLLYPKSIPPLFPFKTRAGLTGISTECYRTSYNKKGLHPHIKVGQSNPVARKGSPTQTKISKLHKHPSV